MKYDHKKHLERVKDELSKFTKLLRAFTWLDEPSKFDWLDHEYRGKYLGLAIRVCEEQPLYDYGFVIVYDDVWYALDQRDLEELNSLFDIWGYDTRYCLQNILDRRTSIVSGVIEGTPFNKVARIGNVEVDLYPYICQDNKREVILGVVGSVVRKRKDFDINVMNKEIAGDGTITNMIDMAKCIGWLEKQLVLQPINQVDPIKIYVWGSDNRRQRAYRRLEKYGFKGNWKVGVYEYIVDGKLLDRVEGRI